MELSGRGVFLTGGAQGIGRAMTAALLDKGARVLFSDINAEVGKATEAELQKQFGVDNVFFMQCDVTDADQLKAAFQTAVSRFGAVEVCCNNAGMLDESNWEKMIAVNTMAQIQGSQLALEHMSRDKGGRGGVIVNTVSSAGLFPFHMAPVYVGTKHALIGFTTSCARDPEMPDKGVRWCCLCPSGVNTNLIVRKGGEVTRLEEFQKLMETAPLLEPEEVAQAFIQLVQDINNNGSIMMVTKDKGSVYHQRMLVEDDGQSNPQLIDTPLTNHPSVPGAGL